MMDDSCSARVRQKFRAIAEQSASRNPIAQPHQPLPGILHLQHLAATRTELFDDHAEKIFGHSDHQLLLRPETFPVETLARDPPWPRYLNSNPSRRIVSMRMVRCSSPRPDTDQVSV